MSGSNSMEINPMSRSHRRDYIVFGLFILVYFGGLYLSYVIVVKP